jgi:UDP-N-acetylglucosamine 2-epimerase (non-hydrolysing)
MKIMCVAGTRPEAIKMAPVILELRKNSRFDVRVLATAQHRQMLDQVFNTFGIVADIDLDIMQPNQSLPTLTARLLLKLDEVLQNEKPDLVIAQGDTTTVMTVAMACFYLHIPFGHVEAGLRTWDMQNPFPEEMNRVIASRLTRWHFAPTESSRKNLLAEGIPDDQIWVTGNTVIDALRSISATPQELGISLDASKRLILVTAHRRENFGEPYKNICRAVKAIADNNPDVQILYPVHPNPSIQKTAYALLSHHPQIILCPPLDYVPFIAAMQQAYIILSDSGGVQEEAPALGKPVLVLRYETERPEAVEAGVVKLVGPDFNAIVGECQRLLDDVGAYKSLAKNISPYGDGRAAERIHKVLAEYADLQ